MTDPAQSPVDALLSMLLTGTVLPQGTPEEQIESAILGALKRHAAPLRPSAPKTATVLSSLERLLKLARQDTATHLLPLRWLAFRALGPVATETVRVDGNPDAAVHLIGLGARAAVAGERCYSVFIEGLHPTLASVLPEAGGRAAILLTPADADQVVIPPEVTILADITLPTMGRLLVGARFATAISNGTGCKPQTVASLTEAAAIIDALPARPVPSHLLAKSTKPGLTAISYEIKDWQPPTKGLNEVVFEPYQPERIRIPGAKEHPSPLVQSQALASIPLPAPTYRPVLPERLIADGVLSEAQLETVIYAGQAHSSYLAADPDDPSAPAPRQGFFIGNGTGAGKGREGAAIIADNFNQARKRAVWISKRDRLIQAARRDLGAVGIRASEIFPQKDTPASAQIPARDGICFSSFALIRSVNDDGTGNRLLQLVDWLGMNFDGVILIDEAHELRNAAAEGSEQSDQGKAGLELQRLLPHARIVYLSATGATELHNLSYAVRLGLWGKGTAFPDRNSFMSAMLEGGIAALELVARDLKAMGLYICRRLSYDGIEYERIVHTLTPAEEKMYDQCVHAWQIVQRSLDRSMISTGLVGSLRGRRGPGGIIRAQFWGAKMRFFNAIYASFKAATLTEAIKSRTLAAGRAAVIQLTNTYEATLERALDALQDGQSLDQLDMTPRDVISQYIDKSYPTQLYQVHGRGKSKTITAVFDKQGNTVQCPKALAEKQQLLQQMTNLQVPRGPLELLFEAFGTSMIAEVTGRKRRVVPKDGHGSWAGSAVELTIEDRTDTDNSADIQAFNNDLKQIIVFSESGGVGESYHSDRNFKNQRPRDHYMLSGGWRADIAEQGLGRTNRTNQASPPRYFLLTTSVKGELRFISAIARGLARMGALCQGQRQAATQGMFDDKDNLETVYAEDAWRNLVRDVYANKLPALPPAAFEAETGLELKVYANRPESLPAITKFLNRLNSMTIKRQDEVYEYLSKRIEEIILENIAKGTYDRGVETIQPSMLLKLTEQVVFKHPRTGAETRYIEMLRRDTITPIPFMEVVKKAQVTQRVDFARSGLTGRVAAFLPAPNVIDENGIIRQQVLDVRPYRETTRLRFEVYYERWISITAHEAQKLWDAEIAALPDAVESQLHVIAGCVLPIWDRLPKHRPIIYRMRTDDGEQILGRVIPPGFVTKVLQNLNASATVTGIPIPHAVSALFNGDTVTLACGWTIRRRPEAGKHVVEIFVKEDRPEVYSTELQSDGVMVHSNAFETRFLLPDDAAQCETILGKITKFRPVTGAAPQQIAA